VRLVEMIVNAIESLLSDKLRSTLSVLGIIISMFSIILIHILGVCVANTVSDVIVEKNEYVKADLSVVPTENNTTVKVDSLGIYDVPDEVKLSDRFMQNMENEFDDEEMQRIYSFEYLNTEMIQRDGNVGKLSIVGCTQAYLEDSCLDVVQGQMFDKLSANDVNVAIVPERFLEAIDVERDHLNQYWRYFDGKYFFDFRIVGVYKEDEYDVKMDETMQIYIPIDYIMSHDGLIDERLDTIQYKVKDISDVEKFRNDLVSYYDYYHACDEWTLMVRFDIDQRETINKYIQLAVQIVTIIGMLTFLIGAMCVINMMVIMVDEKMMELGIKRALGARKKDVYVEILIEALVLVIFGVLFGVILGCVGGYFCIYIISYVDKSLVDMNYFRIPWELILGSVVVSFVIGIVAAVGPIIKVKDCSICEVLNHE